LHNKLDFFIDGDAVLPLPSCTSLSHWAEIFYPHISSYSFTPKYLNAIFTSYHSNKGMVLKFKQQKL